MRALLRSVLTLASLAVLAACGGRTGLEVEISVDSSTSLEAGLDYDLVHLLITADDIERSTTAEIDSQMVQPYRFYVFAEETARPMVTLHVNLLNTKETETKIVKQKIVPNIRVVQGEITPIQVLVD